MSDNDVQGDVSRLMDICQSPGWAELWQDLQCVLCTFADFELADPDRIRRDAKYAELVVARLFDVLVDVGALRGTGRLYLP